MYRIGNKILKLGGKILKAENQTVIELTVRGTSFPDKTSFTIFRFDSTAGNKMYIDYADGTGIQQYLPNIGNIFSYNNQVLHYYQDLADPAKIGTIDSNYPQQRVVRIWFDFPQRITGITFNNIDIYDSFPKRIGNYNLSIISISNSRFLNSFPINFRGGVFSILSFNLISQVKLTNFPTWIGQSKITSLWLHNVFNFGFANTVTGIDQVANVQGLTHLRITQSEMTQNSHFPSTLKDISTLRNLGTGGNNFATLPDRVAECSQIETLIIAAADGFGYNSSMTSWGVGLGSMVNLRNLTFVSVGNGTTLTTDLPSGLINCPLLKVVDFSLTFLTVARIDANVNNWYDFIIANASTTPGNTAFRNMDMRTHQLIASFIPIRPSGGATPTSVVYPATTPIQRIYNLCKDYGHTWTVRNFANTGSETITPTS